MRAQPVGLEANGTLELQHDGVAQLQLTMPRYRLGQPIAGQPIEGRVQARLPDVGFLAALSTEVSTTSGRVSADFSFGGQIGAPRMQGTLTLADASATLPASASSCRTCR